MAQTHVHPCINLHTKTTFEKNIPVKLAKKELGRYLAVGCTSKFSAETHHDVTTVHKSRVVSVRAGVHCSMLHEKHVLHGLTEVKAVDKQQAPDTVQKYVMFVQAGKKPATKEIYFSQAPLSSSFRELSSFFFLSFFFHFNCPDSFDRTERN